MVAVQSKRLWRVPLQTTVRTSAVQTVIQARKMYMACNCWDSLLSISKYYIQKLSVLMVMLKPNLLKNCFTTTLMHAQDYPNLVPLQQPNIQNTSEVKPVCRLSESSSSLYMLRQKFTGSQVATQAALSPFASKFPLIWAPAWLKQVAITYK